MKNIKKALFHWSLSSDLTLSDQLIQAINASPDLLLSMTTRDDALFLRQAFPSMMDEPFHWYCIEQDFEEPSMKLSLLHLCILSGHLQKIRYLFQLAQSQMDTSFDTPLPPSQVRHSHITKANASVPSQQKKSDVLGDLLRQGANFYQWRPNYNLENGLDDVVKLKLGHVAKIKQCLPIHFLMMYPPRNCEGIFKLLLNVAKKNHCAKEILAHKILSSSHILDMKTYRSFSIRQWIHHHIDLKPDRTVLHLACQFSRSYNLLHCLLTSIDHIPLKISLLMAKDRHQQTCLTNIITQKNALCVFDHARQTRCIMPMICPSPFTYLWHQWPKVSEDMVQPCYFFESTLDNTIALPFALHFLKKYHTLDALTQSCQNLLPYGCTYEIDSEDNNDNNRRRWDIVISYLMSQSKLATISSQLTQEYRAIKNLESPFWYISKKNTWYDIISKPIAI